jgi:hypothetical protein
MLSNDIQRWTYSKSSCKFLLILNSGSKIAKSYSNHNHDKTEENIIRRQTLSNCLTRKTVEDVFAKSSKLIILHYHVVVVILYLKFNDGFT